MDEANTPLDELTQEDRAHGRLALKALTSWETWVKRRVEAVTFVNDTTVVKRVSVDFRVRRWFDPWVLEWGADPERRFYYVPIALLEKQPLVNFDVRDEDGKAVPLLTRRKNAAIAASTLVALAQRTILSHIDIQRAGTTERTSGLPHDADPTDICIPEELERAFWALAYRPWRAHHEAEAKQILESFLDPPTKFVDVGAWRWEKTDRGYEAVDTEPAQWRWELARDASVRELMTDLARLFMVTVPVERERLMRRILKFSYEQHVAEPPLALWRGAKKRLGRTRLDWFATLEDRVEGIPQRPEEWREPAQDERKEELAPLSFWDKASRAAGWRTKSIVFDLPAVGEGGSFHFEASVPDGLQIRRAELIAVGSGSRRDYVKRGDRSLQRVHLYLGGVPAGYLGRAVVAIKPRTSTLVRAASLIALLTFALFVAAFPILDELTGNEKDGVEPAAALLLLIPALLAGVVQTGSDHALTRNVVFGLRIVTTVPAVAAVAAIGVLLARPTGFELYAAWSGLAALTFVALISLLVAWRLAGRGRPDLKS